MNEVVNSIPRIRKFEFPSEFVNPECIRDAYLEISSQDLSDDLIKDELLDKFKDFIGLLPNSPADMGLEKKVVSSIIKELFTIIFFLGKYDVNIYPICLVSLFEFKLITRHIFRQFCYLIFQVYTHFSSNFFDSYEEIKTYIQNTVDIVSIGFKNEQKSVTVNDMVFPNSVYPEIFCHLYFAANPDQKSMEEMTPYVTNFFLSLDHKYPTHFIDFLGELLKVGQISLICGRILSQKYFIESLGAESATVLMNYINLDIFNDSFRTLIKMVVKSKNPLLCKAFMRQCINYNHHFMQYKVSYKANNKAFKTEKVYSTIDLNFRDKKAENFDYSLYFEINQPRTNLLANMNFNPIIELCDLESFDIDFWEDLSKIEGVVIKQSILERIQNMVPPTILVKLAQDPLSVIKQEDANEIFNSSDDLAAINSLLINPRIFLLNNENRNMNNNRALLFERPHNIEFWIRYAEMYNKKISNRRKAVRYFTTLIDSNSIKLSELFFHDDVLPSKNLCGFIKEVMKFRNNFIIDSIGKSNDFLLDHINQPFFKKFWCMISGERINTLLEMAPPNQKPYFYYGSKIRKSELFRYPLSQPKFGKQNEDSYKTIKNFIFHNNITDYFLKDLPYDFNTDALYFISSTYSCFENPQINFSLALNINDPIDFFLFVSLYISFFQDLKEKQYKLKIDFFTKEKFFLKNYKNFFKRHEGFSEPKTIDFLNVLFNKCLNIQKILVKNIDLYNCLIKIIIDLIFYYTNIKDDTNFLPKVEIWGKVIELYPSLPVLVEETFVAINNELDLQKIPKFLVEFFDCISFLNLPKILYEKHKSALQFFNNRNNSSYKDKVHYRDNIFINKEVDNNKNDEDYMIQKRIHLKYYLIKINVLKCIDSVQTKNQINELIKEPSPELLNFIDDPVHKLNIDKDKITNILLDYLSIRQGTMQQISSFVKDQLNQKQIKSIIQANINSFTFVEIIKLIKNVNDPLDKLILFELKLYRKYLIENIAKSSSQIANNQSHILYVFLKDFLDTHHIPSLNNICYYKGITTSDLRKLDTLLNSGFPDSTSEETEVLTYILRSFVNDYTLNEPYCVNSEFFNYSKNDTQEKSENLEEFKKLSYASQILPIILDPTELICFMIKEIIFFNKTEKCLLTFFDLQQAKTFASIIPSMSAHDKTSMKELLKYVKKNKSLSTDSLSILELLKFLMIDDVKFLDDIYKNICQRLIYDSTGVLFYINLFQSYSPSIKVEYNQIRNKLLQTFDNINDNQRKCFEQALNETFFRDLFSLYYKDVEYINLKKPTRQSLDFINYLLQNGPKNEFCFYLIGCFVKNFPFLFTANDNFDLVEYIESILPYITEAHKAGLFLMLDEEKITAAVITLLGEFSMIRVYMDKIVKYFFTNCLDDKKFNEHITLAFLLILRKLTRMRMTQTIMIGCFIQNNFINNYLIPLISLYGKNNSLVVSSLLEITVLMIRGLNNERNGTIDALRIISNTENPFSSLIDNRPIIPVLDETNSSPINLLNNNGEYNEYNLKMTNVSHFTVPIGNSLYRTTFERMTDVLSFISTNEEDEKISISQENSKISCPDDIPPKFFKDLPNRMQLELLNKRIPKLNRMLTLEMQEYLITKLPGWVAQWIITRPKVSLLQHHYEILIKTINELNSMSKSNAEVSIPELKPLDLSVIYRFIFEIPKKDKIWKLNRDFVTNLVLHITTIPNGRLYLIDCAKDLFHGATSSYQFQTLIGIFSVVKKEIIHIIAEEICKPRHRADSNLLNFIIETYQSSIFKAEKRFFKIAMMSDNPKVLHKALIFSSIDLIKENSNAVAQSILRCINSKNMLSHYFKFFNVVKDSCADLLHLYENKIIDKIKLMNESAGGHLEPNTIMMLFSLLPEPKIENPRLVCEEHYEELSSFWKLVFDNRETISNMLMEKPGLIDTNFKFMRHVFHIINFDFRAKFFRRSMKVLKQSGQRSIVVRRERILEDSFNNISNMDISGICGNLRVNYLDEDGVDAGGILRDWYTNLIKAIFNENYALFISSKTHNTFLPNPNSQVNSNHLDYFKFAGRIFAKAILDQVFLNAHLASALLKKLLGQDLTIDDLEEFDPDVYKSMKWILSNSVSQIPDEMYFTVDIENIGKHETVELIENGSKTLVTDENKENFVRLMIMYRIDKAIHFQCEFFCNGFFEVIEQKKLQIFSPEEFDKIICGQAEIDVQDMKNNCEYLGEFNKDHQTIKLFFKVIMKWSQENLSKLLLFITGSSQVPLGGFAAYKDIGTPICINSACEKGRLITAHTCTNMIDMPLYDSEEEMNNKLLLAIQECNSFGFK